MKIINNNKYSLQEFNDYELRLKLDVIDKSNNSYNIDVYTTQTSVDMAWEDLLEVSSNKVDALSITHHATKEQDEMAKFINEILI